MESYKFGLLFLVRGKEATALHLQNLQVNFSNKQV